MRKETQVVRNNLFFTVASQWSPLLHKPVFGKFLGVFVKISVSLGFFFFFFCSSSFSVLGMMIAIKYLHDSGTFSILSGILISTYSGLGSDR